MSLPDAPLAVPSRSPWLSVWFSPRKTIETIVATRPTYLVVPLACLAAILSFVAGIFSLRVVDWLSDWRIVLLLILGGYAAGVVSLYSFGLFMRWIAGLFGGKASVLELRAVYAWSSVPTIVGAILAVAVFALTKSLAGDNAASPGFLAGAAAAAAILWICGVYSVVLTWLMFARVERFGFWRTAGAYGLCNISLAFMIAIVIRTFLFQPFSIPSGSNVPTLLVGDYMFATKYAYGYSRYSFPFAPPLFAGRIFSSEPQRGDMVVFRLPKDGATDFVKRLVGLPGDRIQLKDGVLIINDQSVARERIADATTDACGSGESTASQWRETLPNGVSYVTLDCPGRSVYDTTSVYTVPPDNYFMLGDNRDNSSDSRALSDVGYIPRDHLIGRVGMIYFSVAPPTGNAKAELRLGRVGMMVR